MNRFLQILCYAISFLFLLSVGCFFENITDQYVRTLQDDLPGKPLPGLTLLFIRNPLSIPYLILFPWLIFVGFPLLPFVRVAYWDLNFFLLRFAVFMPALLLTSWVLTLSYVIPFIGISGGMSDEVPPLTPVEFWSRCVFWCFTALIVVGAVWRAFKRQK
jgi:hypothetical protein